VAVPSQPWSACPIKTRKYTAPLTVELLYNGRWTTLRWSPGDQLTQFFQTVNENNSKGNVIPLLFVPLRLYKEERKQYSCPRIRSVWWLTTVVMGRAFGQLVHSIEQKSIALKFSKSRTGSHVTYSCHHNLSRFTFPIFLHSWSFSVYHTLQSNTTRIY